MSIAKQLFQLQEVDVDIESAERMVSQTTSQLGESDALVRAREKVAAARQRFEDLRRQERALEWEIDDLASKLKPAEDKLYGGQVRNPKELSSLQHEVELLKAHRSQLEDKVLGIMEQAEDIARGLAAADSEFKAVEKEWRECQQKLSADLERLNMSLVGLRQKRQQQAGEIEVGVLAIYEELRKQKGTAVARVEQGLCRGCRISLPVSELQRARSSQLVRCGSCGRVLYLA